jgi:Fur family transcriptional regulator, ferric uptake regulator
MPKRKEEFTNEKALFLEHIQASGLRRTAQRDLILEIFLRTEAHLTSEDLYWLVQKKDPSVGHTTVYRTLKLLTEAGLAREVRFGDNKTYYEHHYNHEHHDHMICTECGRVIEFFSPDIEALQDQMADNFGFKPTHHSLRMWGVCSECQSKETGAHTAPPGAQPKVRVNTTMH